MQILPLVQRVGDIREEPMNVARAKHLVVPFRTDGGEAEMEITHEAAAELAAKLTAFLDVRHQPRLMVLPLGHTEIIQRTLDWKGGAFDGNGPLMRLVASVEVHPEVPPGPGRHPGATTLAIRMDRAAATSLVQQIAETGQTMGWPPLPTTANQA